MIFIGVAITGGCKGCSGGCALGAGAPGVPQKTTQAEPTGIATDYCEMQGTYVYNSPTLSGVLGQELAIVGYLQNLEQAGIASNQKFKVNVYAFSSIDGEGKFNLALSSRRVRNLKNDIKNAISARKFTHVSVGSSSGYGETENWGVVDRTKYAAAKKAGGKTYDDFVKTDTALSANRRFILSTRTLPKPLPGWKLSSQLAGGGAGPYGSMCSADGKTPVIPDKKAGSGDECFCLLKSIPLLGRIVGDDVCSTNIVSKTALCWLLPLALLLALLSLLWRLIRGRKKSNGDIIVSVLQMKQRVIESLNHIIKKKTELFDKEFKEYEKTIGDSGAQRTYVAEKGEQLHQLIKSYIYTLEQGGKPFSVLITDYVDKTHKKPQAVYDNLKAFGLESEAARHQMIKFLSQYMKDHVKDTTDLDNKIEGVSLRLIEGNHLAKMHTEFVHEETKILVEMKALEHHEKLMREYIKKRVAELSVKARPGRTRKIGRWIARRRLDTIQTLAVEREIANLQEIQKMIDRVFELANEIKKNAEMIITDFKSGRLNHSEESRKNLADHFNVEKKTVLELIRWLEEQKEKTLSVKIEEPKKHQEVNHDSTFKVLVKVLGGKKPYKKLRMLWGEDDNIILIDEHNLTTMTPVKDDVEGTVYEVQVDLDVLDVREDRKGVDIFDEVFTKTGSPFYPIIAEVHDNSATMSHDKQEIKIKFPVKEGKLRGKVVWAVDGEPGVSEADIWVVDEEGNKLAEKKKVTKKIPDLGMFEIVVPAEHFGKQLTVYAIKQGETDEGNSVTDIGAVKALPGKGAELKLTFDNPVNETEVKIPLKKKEETKKASIIGRVVDAMDGKKGINDAEVKCLMQKSGVSDILGPIKTKTFGKYDGFFRFDIPPEHYGKTIVIFAAYGDAKGDSRKTPEGAKVKAKPGKPIVIEKVEEVKVIVPIKIEGGGGLFSISFINPEKDGEEFEKGAKIPIRMLIKGGDEPYAPLTLYFGNKADGEIIATALQARAWKNEVTKEGLIVDYEIDLKGLAERLMKEKSIDIYNPKYAEKGEVPNYIITAVVRDDKETWAEAKRIIILKAKEEGSAQIMGEVIDSVSGAVVGQAETFASDNDKKEIYGRTVADNNGFFVMDCKAPKSGVVVYANADGHGEGNSITKIGNYDAKPGTSFDIKKDDFINRRDKRFVRIPLPKGTGPKTKKISGYVYEAEDGKTPIPDAEVWFDAAISDEELRTFKTKTDDKGYFEFKDILSVSDVVLWAKKKEYDNGKHTDQYDNCKGNPLTKITIDDKNPLQTDVVIPLKKKEVRVAGPPDIYVTMRDPKMPHHGVPESKKQYGSTRKRIAYLGEEIIPPEGFGNGGSFDVGSEARLGELDFLVFNDGGKKKIKWSLDIFHQRTDTPGHISDEPVKSSTKWGLKYNILYGKKMKKDATGIRAKLLSRSLPGRGMFDGPGGVFEVFTRIKVPEDPAMIGKYYVQLQVMDAEDEGVLYDVNYIEFEVVKDQESQQLLLQKK